MTNTTIHEIPEVDPETPETAVRIYGQDDVMEDFPVLKAFQRYIDDEQARARKRMLMLCAFFCVIMVVVIAVFVGLLMNVSSRNQSLNDRLVEYVMKERERQAAVVVQASQDSAALQAMTKQLDALQRKLAEDQARAEKERAEAAEKARQTAIEAAKPKGPTPEELEIKRLKALLAAEKKKHDDENEKKRQAELEEYRRKHYPEYRRKHYSELYEDESSKIDTRSEKEVDDELERILSETPLKYFDDEDSEDQPLSTTNSVPQSTTNEVAEGAEKNYSIPVDVKESSNENWLIP